MFDVQQIIQSGGLLLIGLIVFAETGLLIGLFFPGDTLLFSAGFLASTGKLPLGWLLVVVCAAAIGGYYSGYHIGRRFGPKLFKKPNGLFFRQEYLIKSEAFYKLHGGKTILLARFIPVVRTLAPVVAGMGKMPAARFSLFNIAGGLLWGLGVTLLGYWLGSRIPNIDHYLLPIMAGAVLLTFGPSLYHLIKEVLRKRKNASN